VLEAEGVTVSDEYRVDVGQLLWWPPDQGPNGLQVGLISES
jgi:hypothetical protein